MVTKYVASRLGLRRPSAPRAVRFIAAWVWLSALVACGNSAQPASGNAESGGPGGGNSGAGPGAGAGGVNAGGSSGSSGGVAGTGGGNAAGSAATDPKTKGEACVFYARHFCKQRAKCEGKTDACASVGASCPDLLFSEGSTRTIESVVACGRQWDVFPCAQMAAGQQPACVTPGTRQPGEACVFPTQCSTLSCSATGTSCGVCQVNAADGENCSSTRGCSGFRGCDRQTRHCAPLTGLAAQVGEGCPTGDCVVGAYCSATAGKLCRPLPGLGEACPDTVCDPQKALYCATDNTCQALPGDGQPCATTSAQKVVCVPEAVCDGGDVRGQTCVAVPVSKKGDTCLPNTLCGGELLCSGGVCSTYADPGEPCSDGSTVCRPGSQCDGTLCQAEHQGIFERTCIQ